MSLSQLVIWVVGLIVVFVAFKAYLWPQTVFNEGFSNQHPRELSDLTQGIGYHNQISWDNVPNPYLDQTLRGRRSPVVPLAHGFPLMNEEHATVPVKNSMVYFQDYACRPECCLTSSWSCSKGCVCWTPPKEPDHPVRRNEKITPSS